MNVTDEYWWRDKTAEHLLRADTNQTMADMHRDEIERLTREGFRRPLTEREHEVFDECVSHLRFYRTEQRVAEIAFQAALSAELERFTRAD